MNKVLRYKKKLSMLICTALFALGSANAEDNSLSADKMQSLYEQAYIYALPINMSYKTMYAYAIDDKGANYKAPFNQIKNTARVYGPKDTAVVSANSDTPYSLLWMDLRAEPVVLCVPKIEKSRYYSVMTQDLSTNLLPYMGSRSTGNDGACSVVVGPSFSGKIPEDIGQRINAKTDFVISVYRTQLFNPEDLSKVQAIQEGYLVQTLSRYFNQKPAKPAETIDFPKWDENAALAESFISFLNFNLQFISPSDEDQAIIAQLAAIGVGPGLQFDPSTLNQTQRAALDAGIASAKQKIDKAVATLPGPLGYTAQDYAADWLKRAAVTQLGWGANSEKEALYPNYAKDSNGDALDASKSTYKLTFAKDSLPPVNAFWSLTMYDAKTQLMIENPLNRYLLNSTMIDDMRRNEDGSLSLYLQNSKPKDEFSANWLPAPQGPFYMLMRLYWPQQAILDGTWQQPVVEKVN